MLILSGHSDLWKWRCKGDISVCDIRVVRFHALTVPLIGDGFGVRRDGSGAAVDGHQLSWMQAYRGVAGGDDGGDSVFAGHPGGVRSEAAAVGDDAGCSGEQRRPCRGGGFRDKHIALAEAAEVLRALHDAYRSVLRITRFTLSAYPLESRRLQQPHRPVNTRPPGMLRQRRAGGSTLQERPFD